MPSTPRTRPRASSGPPGGRPSSTACIRSGPTTPTARPGSGEPLGRVFLRAGRRPAAEILQRPRSLPRRVHPIPQRRPEQRALLPLPRGTGQEHLDRRHGRALRAWLSRSCPLPEHDLVQQWRSSRDPLLDPAGAGLGGLPAQLARGRPGQGGRRHRLGSVLSRPWVLAIQWHLDHESLRRRRGSSRARRPGTWAIGSTWRST